jgi:hypothetical protein
MGSLSLFSNIPSWSDSFGIDTRGAFGSVGDSLGSNPFGIDTSGAFGSNIPSWSDSFGIDTSGAFGSGGFGGLGQFAPLIAGRFGSMLMGNANTAQSAQNAMGTSIGMFDMNQGVAAADRRRATYEDMMNPIRASRIRMNPEYRRGQVRDTLLSGPNRYSVFMA